jgi:C_GCAxxG_C_C family probable redox protein
MEKENGLSFNCAESVVIQVNREIGLPGFCPACMKSLSVLGGGVAGMGEVCGAVMGGVIALGLLGGTEGNEVPDVFTEQRKKIREIVRTYIGHFTTEWGSPRCATLLAIDRGETAPTGLKRTNDWVIRNRCDDYVAWSSKAIVEVARTELGL